MSDSEALKEARTVIELHTAPHHHNDCDCDVALLAQALLEAHERLREMRACIAHDMEHEACTCGEQR